MNLWKNLIKIYNRIVFEQIEIIDLFSVFNFGDDFENNIFHYAALIEDIDFLKKLLSILSPRETLDYIQSKRNDKDETPLDWIYATKNNDLIELIENFIRKNRTSYIFDKNVYNKYALNFITSFNTYRYEQIKIKDDPIYGFFEIKKRLSEIVSFSDSYDFPKIIIKGAKLEPKSKRDYLNLFAEFGKSSLTTKEVISIMRRIGEKTSNINEYLKRLHDVDLLSTYKKVRQKKDKTAPRKSYVLVDFYKILDDCSEILVSKNGNNISKIKTIELLKSTGKWLLPNLSFEQYILYLRNILQGYNDLFSDKYDMEKLHQEYITSKIQDHSERKKIRGRKKQEVDSFLWDICFRNFTKAVLSNSETYNLSKEVILKLIIELIHERAKYYGFTKSLEFQDIVSNFLINTFIKNYQDIKFNLICPVIDYEMSYLHIAYLCLSKKIPFTIYINEPRSEVWSLILEINKILNSSIGSIENIKDYNFNNQKLNEKNYISYINLSHHMYNDNYEKKIKFISVFGDIIFILWPKVNEEIFVNFLKIGRLSKTEIDSEIERSLAKRGIILNIRNLQNIVVIKDNAISGTDTWIGLLVINNKNDNEISSRVALINSKIDWRFKFLWLKEVIMDRYFNFIIEK